MVLPLDNVGPNSRVPSESACALPAPIEKGFERRAAIGKDAPVPPPQGGLRRNPDLRHRGERGGGAAEVVVMFAVYAWSHRPWGQGTKRDSCCRACSGVARRRAVVGSVVVPVVVRSLCPSCAGRRDGIVAVVVSVVAASVNRTAFTMMVAMPGPWMTT